MADRFYERERFDEEERYGRSPEYWRYGRDYGYDREPYYRGYSSAYHDPYYRGYGYGTYSNEPYRSRYYSSYYNEPYERSYGTDRWYNDPYNRSRYGHGPEERSFWQRAGDELRSWFGDEEAERRRRMDEVRRGSHRGRGPRGYKRTDERIREDVNDRLTDDYYLDASEIEVTVKDCVVTLTGSVDDRQDK